MPHLLVVLQTHSLGDSQHYLKFHEMKRYCGADKPEVLRRCTSSLIDSLNYAQTTLRDLDIELQVFDDHSDEQSLAYLQQSLNKARFPVNLEHLETSGIMPSILKCYEHGRDHGKEWVYFVQDDYLYEENAIRDMLLAINTFSRNLNAPASIYPFNDPFKYEPVNTVIQSRLVRAEKRHWKTHIHTASCFMTHKLVIDKEWDLFEKMGKDVVHGKMEEESINRLFYQRGYNLFVPIPSLALHMQYSTEEDPLYDWRPLWDKYDLSDSAINRIDKTARSVLNVGAGGSTMATAIYTEDLVHLKEYTLDIDKNKNPDICADVTNLSGVEDEIVDVVYTSHMMEHLDYYKVVPVIKDFLRITKPGGQVRIVVPDIQSIAAKLVEGDILGTVYESPAGPISALDMLYGHRVSVLRGSEFMRHKTGFTKQSFTQMLEAGGLQNYTVESKGFDLLVKINK